MLKNDSQNIFENIGKAICHFFHFVNQNFEDRIFLFRALIFLWMNFIEAKQK